MGGGVGIGSRKHLVVNLTKDMISVGSSVGNDSFFFQCCGRLSDLHFFLDNCISSVYPAAVYFSFEKKSMTNQCWSLHLFL